MRGDGGVRGNTSAQFEKRGRFDRIAICRSYESAKFFDFQTQGCDTIRQRMVWSRGGNFEFSRRKRSFRRSRRILPASAVNMDATRMAVLGSGKELASTR